VKHSKPFAKILPGLTALAALLACGGKAQAQATIEVPDVRGDQLVFFYDARTNRTPFLSVTNPSSTTVNLEVAFYPASLANRLGQFVVTVPAAGNVVIDPTSAAGGVAAGNAGLAVVTPVASASSTQAVVPPEPLIGNFTLANTALGAAFGENALGRLAVDGSGSRADAGEPVDGASVKYQRFTPPVLMVPAYFNPTMLAPPANDGNRVIVAAFADRYGSRFDVAPAAAGESLAASFFDSAGQLVGQATVPVNGVLLSDLQQIAGGSTLDSSGKVFFDPSAIGADENVFGIFSQSLATFASGQRMPAVDAVPVGSGA
jgi:hypothetical protein